MKGGVTEGQRSRSILLDTSSASIDPHSLGSLDRGLKCSAPGRCDQPPCPCEQESLVIVDGGLANP